MMKKFLPLTFALALCGFLLTGCEEDVLSGDDPSMKADVDGVAWEANSVVATGSSTIVITATKLDGTAILLTIPGDATVGEHALPSTSYIAVYRPDASTTTAAVTGSITIDAISDSQVSGKFAFNAIDNTPTTYEITGGTFVANRN